MKKFVIVLLIIALLLPGCSRSTAPDPSSNISEGPESSASQSSRPSASPSPAVSPSPSPSEEIEYIQGRPVTSQLDVDGELREAQLIYCDIGNSGVPIEITMYADLNLYDFSLDDNGTASFIPKSGRDGLTFLFIGFAFDRDAASLAPSFMDSYIDFKDIEFDGSTSVGDTGLSGQYITASNSTSVCHAYLIDVDNYGVVTIVYSSIRENNDDLVFEAMIDSFEFC